MIDQQVFLEEIGILMDWFNRDFEETTLKRLHQSLSQYLTTEQFRQAACLVFEQSRFFPTVEDFVSAVKGNQEAFALQEWNICLKAASRGDTSVTDSLTEAGKLALRLIGGFSELGRTHEDELRWVKKEFINVWKSWKPSVSSALPPALDNSRLSQVTDSQLSNQVLALSQKMSLKGRENI